METVVARLRSAAPRTWLFVPALRVAEFLPKALASGADAIIVDLEDATAPAEKDRAREVVRTAKLANDRTAIFVRVNAEPTARFDADLAAAADSGATGVMLPKCWDPAEIARAVRVLKWREVELERAPLAVLPMAETARGVLNAFAVAAAHDRVVGLAFGAFDLAADIGATHTPEGTESATARGLVALGAAAAGVGAIDSPWFDLRDHPGAGRDAARARALGFAGKLCVHPAQVEPVNKAFTPSAKEVATARGLVAAFDKAVADGSGIAVHEGQMIDRPAVVAAQRVLARAELAKEAKR